VADGDPKDARWLRSSFSANAGECVEICDQGAVVEIRDSRDPEGPTLLTARAEWRRFVAGVRAGEFDH
jgi:hypothetical protein